MAPGGNVRRDNCASYNGWTSCTTRIGSWTVIIYYVDIHWPLTFRVLSIVISWCVITMLTTHRYTFTWKSAKFRSSKVWLKTVLAMSTVGLRAIDYDSIRTRRKWCGVRSREEQVLSISYHLPLVTRRSLHQTSFVTLECNFEPTFQLLVRSVRSFAVATTIFSNFG